ncbi:carboxyl transferase domain-containing protein [Pseudonocardia sp. NPDC049154]|uniref:carboxyl transferase domain-containing protein n=1 Tax=Pseudonocardia sp. NPDC049154 TaxID=3155501 RepID=UPI0033FA12F0
MTPRSRQLLDTVLDDGTFRSWDTTPAPVPLVADTPQYRAELAAAHERSGVDEAVVTGEGLIAGRRVAVVCSEFAFLAGSIGVATAERLIRAIERATDERLPLLAATASGGTRMQEGAIAFLRMAAISAAVTAHKAAGLPYLVYLRHPTTGGVFASWGSLGNVTVAEPGALVGFLGPKVYSALHGERFPEGVQKAENLHRHGIVDAVLPAERLAGVAARVLAMLDPVDPMRLPPSAPARGEPTGPDEDAWSSIERSRRPERPGVRDVLRLAATDVVPLGGTGEGEAGRGLLLALVRFGSVACVLLGQDRRAQAAEPLGPGALRTARRGMRLAAELGLPVVSVIDTTGAALSVEAEEGGLAGEIARCLGELTELPVPTVSVLLGQGTGGAALALLPTDRVIAARHGWLTPLPPEGASTIVHGTPEKAAEVAAQQHVRAVDLLRAGAVDTIVDEHPDAADEPEAFARRVADAVESELRALLPLSPVDRLVRRRRRYRTLGLR